MSEVLQGLALRPGAVVLDATVGLGGHAQAILGVIGPGGLLIGMDRDEEALYHTRIRLERFKDQMKLIHGHFGELARVLEAEGVDALDATLFDLGVSSLQLERANRGFSFSLEGPLDMRMDQREQLTAGEIVNRVSVEELTQLLQDFAQERWATRIARLIVRRRPFATTTELAQTVRGAVPPAARYGRRIDPATRTFQAIRIAVNQELELLPKGLDQAMQRLKVGGRMAVLAYHSLEDRIVKRSFKSQAQTGHWEILTKKPIRPSPEEVARNPRARSAHLRMARRLR